MLSNCRYGPGAAYLYKYALIEDSNLEVFGRNDRGTWILVPAIGGTNPCWVNASLMEVDGDVMGVEPTYISLPQSLYNGPLTGVSARRDGSGVTISWRAMALRPGDDSDPRVRFDCAPTELYPERLPGRRRAGPAVRKGRQFPK